MVRNGMEVHHGAGSLHHGVIKRAPNRWDDGDDVSVNVVGVLRCRELAKYVPFGSFVGFLDKILWNDGAGGEMVCDDVTEGASPSLPLYLDNNSARIFSV